MPWGVTVIPCSSSSPRFRLCPSSLQVFPHEPEVPSSLLTSPSNSLTLSGQSSSLLDRSLTTFLPKLIFSVLSRGFRLFSALHALLISCPSHIPHPVAPDCHHPPQAPCPTPSPFLAADDLAACCSDPRVPRPPVPYSPNLTLQLLCWSLPTHFCVRGRATPRF